MAFTEDLLLPSRGIIYNITNFDGIVKVKPFTTKAYKDLLTGNASETALKQFIDSCLVDCPIKAKNMNQNDLLACLFKARAMTLGSKLKTQVKCPECGKVNTIEWDLTNITVNYLCTDEYPIKVTLPISNREIKIRFPTGADIIKAKAEADRRAAKFNKSQGEFLQIFTIVSLIDMDDRDLIEKAEWYETLAPGDAIYIDEVISEMNEVFGVKMTRDEKCPECDHEFNTVIDIGSDFFRPYNIKSLGITSKTGNLAGITEKPNISE